VDDSQTDFPLLKDLSNHEQENVVEKTLSAFTLSITHAVGCCVKLMCKVSRQVCGKEARNGQRDHT